LLKKGVVFFPIFLIFFSFLISQEEDVLQISASIRPKVLSRGQEGKVVLSLSIDDEVLITPHPYFTIELNPSEEFVFPKNFFTASDLEIEIIEKNGEEYLNIDEPIEIPFTVKKDAKRGEHRLEGKIKYFACFKNREWCIKNTTEFLADYYIRKPR